VNKNISIVILIALVIAGSAYYINRQLEPVSNTLSNDALLASLPQRDESNIDTSHLAAGLVPPTNKWFSGLALQKQPKTVFSMPNAITASNTAINFSYPSVTSSEGSITSSFKDNLTISVESATHYVITRYDELSVDLTFQLDSERIGTVTLVEGSPYIQFTAHKPAKLFLAARDSDSQVSSNIASFATTTQRFVASTFNGARFSTAEQKVTATMTAGSFVSFHSLPAQQSGDPLAANAGSRLLGATVDYTQRGGQYLTTIKIKTDRDKPTVFGFLPHQSSTTQSTMEYETIYGKQRMIVGNQFSYSTPRIDPSDSLNLTRVRQEDKTLLITNLRREINATKFNATDTYYSGKELYRSAQLLKLANQLKQSDIASTIQTKLRQEITRWLSVSHATSDRHFYYDYKIQSIVGKQASFGSEQINDHHFHYGYFIYAAAILAQYDKAFLQEHKAMVNLLVSDIANYLPDESLPMRRVFDPYFGHSWASGSSPFNDGNNQESVSEALNAWVGISLWASQTKNEILRDEANWMLSLEANSASAYWMNIKASLPTNDNLYAHTIVPLNWSGKRDYSTFFSAEPNAQLGILLIPMNPTMITQLSFGKAAIDAHVQEALRADYNVQFGDYILMYSSLADTSGKLEIARNLPAELIDGANSRSYMTAWILSLEE
jgi:endoglucanase Acf2